MKNYLKIIWVLLCLNCSISLFAQEIKDQKNIMDVEITVFQNKIVLKNISNEKRIVKVKEIFDNKEISYREINFERQKESAYVYKENKSRVEIEILENYGKNKNISFSYVARE